MKGILIILTVLVTSLTAPAKEEGKDGHSPDDSTKVTATVTLPKHLASFKDRALELRLYEYDPRLADVSAKLVDLVRKPGFSHTKGTDTVTKTVIGAGKKITPQRSYYLTIFVLDGKTRTHMGERDGKSGLCKVLTDGHPRQVTIIARAVR